MPCCYVVIIIPGIGICYYELDFPFKMRTTRRLQAVKDANGGEIPNRLYLEPNQRLSAIILDFTGVQPSENATTKELVTQILEIIKTTKVDIPPGSEPINHHASKRKADDIEDESKNDDSSAAPLAMVQPTTVKSNSKSKKPPRWLVEELDPLNIAEMKRMLFVPVDVMYKRYTAGDLMLMWNAMGMKTEYPLGSWTVGKDDNIAKMRIFAQRNLEYHGAN